MFPAFSQMGSDARQQRARYYLTLIRYVSWITLPMACAMILFAPEFIHGLYGDVWAPAIVPIQLLAVLWAHSLGSGKHGEHLPCNGQATVAHLHCRWPD